MDTATFVAIVGVGVAVAGIGVTIIVLLVRGGYALGRNTAQVESLSEAVGGVQAEVKAVRDEARQDNQQLYRQLREEIREARDEARQDNQQLRAEMVAGFEKLAQAIDALRVEVQQNNQMLAALANHTHDTDGRTVFTMPTTTVRQ